MKDTRTRGMALQKLRKRVFDYYGDQCWLCHKGGADTIDHIIPVIDGGGDDLDNLRPAHGRKSATCTGNFSRKRSPIPERRIINQTDQSDLVITDDYIEKKIGQGSSRYYYRGLLGLEKALEMARG